MSNTNITKRIFLVGCSRSGTTLLQAMLASHTNIYSLPETSYFIHAVGQKRLPLARLGIATPHAKKSMQRIMRNLVINNNHQQYLSNSPFLKKQINIFQSFLDDRTIDNKRSIWLEKSPMHIRYIDLINKYIKHNQVIHIIRDGRDVVASLYDRAVKYPKFKKQKDIDKLISLWNECILISAKYLQTESQPIITYESIIQNPEAGLKKLCDKIDINYEPEMVNNMAGSNSVIREKCYWVHGAKQRPQKQPSKFVNIFNEDQQKYITDNLKLEVYRHLSSKM